MLPYVRPIQSLSKIDNIVNYDTAEKNKVLGQAHFFRAFQYFTWIQQFGDVPYTDSLLALADQADVKRMPRDEVYD